MLRDEVIYLKVKLRKEGNVNRSEYHGLRDRLQELRARARGERRIDVRPRVAPPDRTGSSVQGSLAAVPAGGTVRTTGAASTTSAPRPIDVTTDRTAIPVGQEIDVRLQNELSSDTAQVEDRFEATTAVDLYEGNAC